MKGTSKVLPLSPTSNASSPVDGLYLVCIRFTNQLKVFQLFAGKKSRIRKTSCNSPTYIPDRLLADEVLLIIVCSLRFVFCRFSRMTARRKKRTTARATTAMTSQTSFSEIPSAPFRISQCDHCLPLQLQVELQIDLQIIVELPI